MGISPDRGGNRGFRQVVPPLGIKIVGQAGEQLQGLPESVRRRVDLIDDALDAAGQRGLMSSISSISAKYQGLRPSLLRALLTAGNQRR
jgi:hypothetical protein